MEDAFSNHEEHRMRPLKTSDICLECLFLANTYHKEFLEVAKYIEDYWFMKAFTRNFELTSFSTEIEMAEWLNMWCTHMDDSSFEYNTVDFFSHLQRLLGFKDLYLMYHFETNTFSIVNNE
jgi:hypothetical protein